MIAGCAEETNLILNLHHQDGSVVAVDTLDVAHQFGECGGIKCLLYERRERLRETPILENTSREWGPVLLHPSTARFGGLLVLRVKM